MKAHKRNSKRREKREKEFQEAVIKIDRVTRVVKGGRRLRFRATVCIGDMKGRVGLGIGKSNEVRGAIDKAIAKAKKNLITVELDGTTIPHDIKTKFKSAVVFMKPAAEGTGIIAGGAIRKVLELAGVKNILTKSLGSTNKINTAKVTVQALQELQATPKMKKAAATKTTAVKGEAPKKAAPKKKAPAKKAPAKKPAAKKAAPKKTTKKES